MSDTQDNIFSPSDSGDTSEGAVEETNVEDLVGEGKKYATVADLAKAYKHINEHVVTLQSENKQYREKLEQAKTIDEVLAALETGKPAEQETPTKAGLSKDEVLSIMQEQASQQRREANTNTVVSKMAEMFGGKEKAEKAFVDKASELGVTVKYLEDMAATSPTLVLRHFESQGKEDVGVRPTSSSVNTPGEPTTDQPMTMSDYLKKARAEGRREPTLEEMEKLYDAEAKKLGIAS